MKQESLFENHRLVTKENVSLEGGMDRCALLAWRQRLTQHKNSQALVLFRLIAQQTPEVSFLQP